MISHTVTITDYLPILLPDGKRLSARMWAPEGAEPLPVIVEIHPYPHAYATATRDEINHGWFAANGYVSLRVDTPGVGDSDGTLSDPYRPDEHEAILHALDWIAAQDWCDGNIGMFGHSWGAYSALQMAARPPAALKAVAISGASDDLYSEDCHYRGGVMATENMGWAATLLSFLSRPPTRAGFGPDRTGKWIDRLQQLEWMLPTWIEHQARDGYWHSGSVCDDYMRVKLPVLAASGWADTYATAVLRMAEHLPGPFAGVIGPWAHKFPHMGLPKPAIGWLQEVVRWWDHWLKGINSGAAALPRLRMFVTEDAAPEAHSDSERKGHWVSEPVWPASEPETKMYHLGDGVLNDKPAISECIIASPPTLGVAGGELMPMGWGADLPGDQRVDDGQSVTFDTAVLTSPLDMLGCAQLELSVTSDQPAGFVVARLCDIHPDGASTRVCYGVRNLTHSDDHTITTYLEPGVPKQIRFDLDATGYRFAAGHRIRLALSNAYWPLLWPSPASARLHVDLSDARIVLPLVSNAAPAPTFDPPLGATPRPRTQLEPSSFERTVQTNQGTGLSIIKVLDIAAREHDAARDLTTWGSTERVYTMSADQTGPTMHSLREINLIDGECHLKTLTDAELHSDEDHFYSKVTLTAWEDGNELVRRQWKNKIPRN